MALERIKAAAESAFGRARVRYARGAALAAGLARHSDDSTSGVAQGSFPQARNAPTPPHRWQQGRLADMLRVRSV